MALMDNTASSTKPNDAPATWTRRTRCIAIAILLLGVIARIACYVSNPSLFPDGASLALNIVDRSFPELFRPLDHLQAAPAGLLVLMKSSTLAFGVNEYALRLVPFAGSLLAFPLFLLLARRTLGTAGALVGLAMLSTSWPLIRYGTLVKQYGTDATVCAGLLLLGVWASTRLRDWRAGLALALGGTVCITLSHPAVFVLAGLGIALAAHALRTRQWRHIAILGAVGAAWLCVFFLMFRLNMRAGTQNSRLVDCWTGSFIPFPPRSTADLEHSAALVFSIFATPVGRPMGTFLSGLVLALSAIGCYAFARTRQGWLSIALPVLFAFLAAASAMQVHPLAARLMVFVTPAVALLCGAAVDYLTDRGQRRQAVGIVLACLLLAPGFAKTAVACLAPPSTQDVRQLLRDLVRESPAPHAVGIHRTARSAHGFYSRHGRNCWRDDLAAFAMDDDDSADTILEKAAAASPGSRLWLVFSMHNDTVAGVRERLCRELASQGSHCKTLSTRRARADLFIIGSDRN